MQGRLILASIERAFETSYWSYLVPFQRY